MCNRMPLYQFIILKKNKKKKKKKQWSKGKLINVEGWMDGCLHCHLFS